MTTLVVSDPVEYTAAAALPPVLLTSDVVEYVATPAPAVLLVSDLVEYLASAVPTVLLTSDPVEYAATAAPTVLLASDPVEYSATAAAAAASASAFRYVGGQVVPVAEYRYRSGQVVEVRRGRYLGGQVIDLADPLPAVLQTSSPLEYTASAALPALTYLDTQHLSFNMPTPAQLPGGPVMAHAMNNAVQVSNNATTEISETADYAGRNQWASEESGTPPVNGPAGYVTAGSWIGPEWRDRYAFRARQSRSDWLVQNTYDILRWAYAAGLNAMSPHWPGNVYVTGQSGATTFEWQQEMAYLDAALRTIADGFPVRIVPWFDPSVGPLSHVGGSDAGHPEWGGAAFGAVMRDLLLSARGDAFFRYLGRPVCVLYNPGRAGEGPTGATPTAAAIAELRALKTAMTINGVAPFFIASYQYSPWATTEDTIPAGAAESMGAIMDAISVFGTRDPDASDSTGPNALGLVAAAGNRGKLAQFPVSAGAVAPRGTPTGSGPGLAWEFRGFDQLAKTAQAAISTGAWGVSLNTASDFGEGSHLFPSREGKRNWLDILSYWLVWLRQGSAPAIVRNVLYIANRKHMMVTDRPTFTSPQDKFDSFVQSVTAAGDWVGVIADCAQVADVKITTGGVTTTFANQSVGRHVLKVAARAGAAPVATMYLPGTSTVLETVTSRNPIRGASATDTSLRSIAWEDAVYYPTGSREDPTLWPTQPDLYTP